MFLWKLNEEQQKAFLSIAMKIIGADGRLDREERNMIDTMRVEMRLFHETQLPSGSIEELAQPFDSRESQSVALINCISLAYADDEMANEEQKILRALALIWEITEEDATEMEKWVLEYNKLLGRANEILSR